MSKSLTLAEDQRVFLYCNQRRDTVVLDVAGEAMNDVARSVGDPSWEYWPLVRCGRPCMPQQPGLWVWVGDIEIVPGSEFELHGVIRRPTPDELEALREGSVS